MLIQNKYSSYFLKNFPKVDLTPEINSSYSPLTYLLACSLKNAPACWANGLFIC